MKNKEARTMVFVITPATLEHLNRTLVLIYRIVILVILVIYGPSALSWLY